MEPVLETTGPLRGDKVFFQLKKFDPFTGIAEGCAAAEELDHDNEVLDYAGSKPYFQAWSDSQFKNSQGKSYGNIRLQHDDTRPIGILTAPLDFRDDVKQVWVKAQIVETESKNLLKAGVLTGFSVGGDYGRKQRLPNGAVKYIAVPSEISACDRPCAPSATFSLVRSNGTQELRKFAKTTIQGDEFEKLYKDWSDSARESAASARAGAKDKGMKAKEHESAYQSHTAASTMHNTKAAQEEAKGHPVAAQAHREAAMEHAGAADKHAVAMTHFTHGQDPEQATAAREGAFGHSERAWSKGWDARMASTAGKAEGNTMKPEQSASLLKAIEEKFFPENGIFGSPKLALEQIEASHALVWVEDRLMKVAYKEEGDQFTVGAATRLSKADLKKHQMDDGTPMTINEEREESAELVAAAAAKTKDLSEVTDPRKKVDPKVTPQPVGGSDTARKGEVCKDCGEVHAPGQEKCSAAKNTGTEMDSAADLEKSLALLKEKAASVAELEKIEAADASLEEITAKFEKLLKSFKEFEASGGGEMDAKEKERLEKARKSIHGHIADMGKALAAHKVAHETVHKAHGNLLDAHKAVHEAHKVAHDARMAHKAAHDAFHEKAATALDGMAKVVGGGPESFGEFGEPDSELHQDPKVTPQPPGAAEYASKAEINTMVAKAVENALGDLKPLLMKAAGVKEDPKPAVVKEDPAPAGALTKADVVGAFTQIFGELAKSLEADAAPGPGSRNNKRPFTKAEDAGGAGGNNPVVEMTAADWEAYRRGDNKAFKKAQLLTSTKWQPVPDRLMKRRQASA